MTILQKFERIPPCMCRLLARKRHGRAGMTHADISRQSGLSVSMVGWLSLRTSWKGIPIDTAVKFAMACGINHLHSERQVDFLKRRKLAYVNNASGQQRRFYNRLFNIKAL